MDRLKELIDRFRRVIVVVVQLALIAASNYMSWLLRYDNELPWWAPHVIWRTLLVIVLIRGLVFVPFRLYQGLWRYTSVYDIQALLGAIATSTVASFFVVQWLFGFDRYPRSIFIIDAIFLTVLLGGTRMVRRMYLDLAHRTGTGKRMLIYGAGDAGEMIARDMIHSPSHEYVPTGFIDDDRDKVGRRIHGIQVLGGRADLAAVIARHQPDAVLIAIPAASPSTTRSILKALEPFSLPIKTLPNLRDVLNGTVTAAQIRNLSVEDLLPRVPVGLDDVSVRELIEGRRVLVTGAAGSIGSELCRQIASFSPKRLLMVDRNENGLYAIDDEFSTHPLRAVVEPIVADITDQNTVDAILARVRPEIVFHAAAHKHVPLMELHPCEAVKNNVGGTRVMVESAERHLVDRFVFISSDKAVSPRSVMGATKRIGELIVQAASGRGHTEFVAVRFGNVLGSNGSVVPKFLKQIEAGGPVTVTHPEMTRFFMLIPEAVQLVLHAAALGGSGTVFVLDMGEPVHVAEMARHLISLAGFVPDEDIEIAYIGLRPGEKMFEELVASGETVESCRIPKVMRIRLAEPPEHDALLFQLAALERIAARGDQIAVVRQLVAMVPSFEPDQALEMRPSATPLSTGHA